LAELEVLASHLQEKILHPADDAGPDIQQRSMGRLLKVRNKNRRVCKLKLNRVQQEVDGKAGTRNIVLKARQVGITTYVAARFSLRTMLQPGTLSVQVAHDQQSAEEIFASCTASWRTCHRCGGTAR
jgi:hypothetical protein